MFYFSAVLTTKAVISGFIFLMLHFPEVQAQIQKEIDAVIGQGPWPRFRGYDVNAVHARLYLRGAAVSVPLPLTAPHANLSADVDFEGITSKGSVVGMII